jgi:thiamine biosynthesis lipoprotein
MILPPSMPHDRSASTPPLSRRGWLALATGLLAWPAARAAAFRADRRPLFGSPVDLLLPSDTPPDAAAWAWRHLETINTEWNAWKPGELAALNLAFRDGRPAPASPALQDMVRRAARLEQASAGLFNPGIGGLVGAWGFHDDDLRPGTRPGAAQLARWRGARPSLAQIEFSGGLLRSDNPALQLDFGAYAKGVAIDQVLDGLTRRGVHDALLNLGGNLAAMGRPGRAPWRVGLRDPRGPGLLATLTTQGREAVVTSGSYERFRLLDGERCSHILDPATGAPAPALVSVTVVHASAALADAAATALLVAGPDRWRRVAERMGVQQVLVVDRHGRQEATAALASRLSHPG